MASGFLDHDGDMRVRGNFGAGTMSVPANSIRDAQVASDAAIGAGKLVNRINLTYSQANGTNNVAKRQYIHRVYGVSGTLQDFKAINRVAASGGDSTSVDLYVNGSSVLSAAIVLNAAAGTTSQSGTISTPAVTQGDRVEVVVTLSGTNVGQEVGVFTVLDETP
jgi:hypothetical protein